MISSKIEDNILYIYAGDQFTINFFPVFQETYEKKTFNQVIIDFTTTKTIDSGGLGMLLQLRTLMGENAKNITLKGVSKQILNVFEVVNFEKLFRMI